MNVLLQADPLHARTYVLTFQPSPGAEMQQSREDPFRRRSQQDLPAAPSCSAWLAMSVSRGPLPDLQ